MRKIYLLSFLLCACLTSFGQATVYIYATGAPGSYTTASCSNATRTEGTMIAIPTVQRSYAIFDLAANLPAGAAIISADLGFDIAAVTGPAGAGNIIRGYNGMLSSITVPSALFTAMGGTAPTIYSTTWSSAVGNDLLPSATTAVTFLQNCFSGGTATGFASLIWAAGTGGPGGLTYTITDESGSATTSGTHAPYLKIDYDCPSLATSATGPATPICANTSFSLTGSAIGASSYQWNGPDGFSSTSPSPTVAGGLTITGTYTLTAYTSAGCPMSDQVTVTINPQPISAITPFTSTAFCTGDDVTLGVPTVAGDTYQWYDGATPIPAATNASYTATGSGNFTVKVTDGAGCTSTTPVGTPTVLFNGSASLSPGSPLLLCSGSTGAISVDVNGVSSGINYQWKQAGVAIAGATNGSYSTTTSGYYSVDITVPANTCTVTSTIDTVIVNAYPTPAVTMSGGFLRTSATYAVYQWFLNTVAIPGATSFAVAPTSNGGYRVRVTDVNGCTAFSESFSYGTAGVGQLNAQGVSIYPNPAGNTLHIEAPEAVKAVVAGLEGRILLQQENVKDMNVSKLATGMYFISLYNDKGERIAVQQFMKE